MKKEFKFLDNPYALEMNASAEADGGFMKCAGTVFQERNQCEGVFKLTKYAWEVANKKAQGKSLEEVLVNGSIDALIAELYIRPIPDGFTYVVDHRFFENL